MKNYEKMWTELKRCLLSPPSQINKDSVLRTMAKIEVDETNEIPRIIQFEPLATFSEVKEDEPKGIRKFFKGK